MAQKVKPSPTHFSKKAILLVILFFALITSIVYVVFDGYSKASEERTKFASLQSSIKSLQNKLNQEVPGWIYDEGCRGKGGVYNRDEPLSCTISIVNESDEPSLIRENFDTYEDYVEDYFVNSVLQSTFAWSSSNTSDTRTYRATGYSLNNDDKVQCMLREFYSDDNPLSIEGGVIYSCNRPSSEFYYPRYDL